MNDIIPQDQNQNRSISNAVFFNPSNMIQSVWENLKIPVHGIIKMGTMDKNNKNKMENTPYFNLEEAPEVERVYREIVHPKMGKAPDAPIDELHIVFPLDNIGLVARSQFEMWKSYTNREGKRVPKLVCQSSGPAADGTPGKAIWKDRKKAPPAKECIGGRDRRGYISRVCYGEECTDWKNDRGQSLCGPVMRLYVRLPLVSGEDNYLITLTSWKSIHSVSSWIAHTHGTGRSLKTRVFSFYKEPEKVEHYNDQTGDVFERMMPITKMKPVEENFNEVFGSVMTTNAQVSSSRPVIAVPLHEGTPLLPPFKEVDEEVEVDIVGSANTILEDPEVKDAFVQLEVALKKKPDVKSRQKLVATVIAREQGKGGDVKQSILRVLNNKLREAQGPVAPISGPETSQAEESSPKGAPPKEPKANSYKAKDQKEEAPAEPTKSSPTTPPSEGKSPKPAPETKTPTTDAAEEPTKSSPTTPPSEGKSPKPAPETKTPTTDAAEEGGMM